MYLSKATIGSNYKSKNVINNLIEGLSLFV